MARGYRVAGPGSGGREERRLFWRGHIEAQGRSGLSIRGYCREHRLAEGLFYQWRRRLWREDGGVSGGEMPSAGGHTGSRATGRQRGGALFARVRVSRNPCGCADPVSGGGGEGGAASEGLEVVLPGGRLVRVRPGFDGETLLRLVSVLEEAEAC